MWPAAAAPSWFKRPAWPAVRGWRELLRPGGTLAISEFGDLDPRWAWKDELLARLGPPLEPLGGGHLGPQELKRLLRSAGGTTVQVQAERLDVVYRWEGRCGLMTDQARQVWGNSAQLTGW